MLNKKIYYKILGSLLFIEASLLLICLIMAIAYGENDIIAFALSTLVAVFFGSILKYAGRKAENRMNRRDGYLVVSTSWIAFSIIGMLPFLISGNITNVTDAFFETMSGFTTTGASVVNNIESFPHALLFWRSLTQWIGGLGIVFFTLAILPTVGFADVKLFAAEATGPRHNKLHPRIKTTAKWLWTTYTCLTIGCAICLFVCGMNPFDAINHALTTTATGGYSTHQDSISFFKSPMIEYVEIIFMFLSGINFTLLYLFLVKRKIKQLFEDSEFRAYFFIVFSLTIIIAISLIHFNNYGTEHAFRSSLFTIVSSITTTGFVTENFALWAHPIWILILMVMCSGACAGSTSGSIKIVRVLMLFKTAFNEFKHILHPNAVVPVRINKTVISSTVERTLLSFMFFYILLIVVGMLAFMLMGLPTSDSFSIALTSISNNGPVIGYTINPTNTLHDLPDAGKWICSFLMLTGRLEIFSVLLPCLPQFWKDN